MECRTEQLHLAVVEPPYGNVETDFLNGEIVRLAHRHGITAPLYAALARAARAAARNGLGPRRFSAAQPAELLGINAIATAQD